MRVVSFDVETYPDLFTIAAKEIYTGEEYQFIYEIGNSDANLYEWFDSLSADIYVGYNSISFDSPVINYAAVTKDPRLIADFANICATSREKRTPSQQEVYKQFAYRVRPVLSKKTHIDLLLIFNKIDRVSLKRLAISMGWLLIQDLPYPPGSFVSAFKDEIIKYNFNDTRITAEGYVRMFEELKLRFDISNQYGVDVISSSRSVMGAKLMEKLYLKEHPELTVYELRDMRTWRKELDFSKIVSPRVHFQTKQLNDILTELKGLKYKSDGAPLRKKNLKWKKTIRIGNMSYTIGFGGIHSNNLPEILKGENGVRYIDADVESYYPRLMITEQAFPEHLGRGFLILFEKIVTQRVEAKRAKITIIAEALKITINAIFGKMGGENEWFYDLEALYKVTINGQLFLLMLIERLTELGIDVYYGNTDGITAKLREDQVDLFYQVCHEWEKELGFALEFAEIESGLLRDVNNYTLKIKGKSSPKEKGDFLTERKLGKKVDAEIVAIAINKWFYEGIPIEDTVNNTTDIEKFVMTGKVGDQFDAIFLGINNHQKEVTKLQRVNRYVAATGTNSGSILKKRKSDGGLENMLSLSSVVICNDYGDLPPIKLNRRYYIQRAYRLISAFNTQQTLF